MQITKRGSDPSFAVFTPSRSLINCLPEMSLRVNKTDTMSHITHATAVKRRPVWMSPLDDKKPIAAVRFTCCI